MKLQTFALICNKCGEGLGSEPNIKIEIVEGYFGITPSEIKIVCLSCKNEEIVGK